MEHWLTRSNKYLYYIYKIICRIYNIIIKHTLHSLLRIEGSTCFFFRLARVFGFIGYFHNRLLHYIWLFCGFHAVCRFGFRFKKCTTIFGWRYVWKCLYENMRSCSIDANSGSFFANWEPINFKEGRIENIYSINFHSCSNKVSFHLLSFNRMELRPFVFSTVEK